MATSTSQRSQNSTKSRKSDQNTAASSSGRGSKGATGLGDIINNGLSGSFDAIREKISQSITDNGEEYLQEAAAKISKSTSQVVEWSKKHPVKLAVGVAALMAVSAFLVHTIKNYEGSGEQTSKKRGRSKQMAAKA